MGSGHADLAKTSAILSLIGPAVGAIGVVGFKQEDAAVKQFARARGALAAVVVVTASPVSVDPRVSLWK